MYPRELFAEYCCSAGLSMFKGSKHVVFTLTNDSLYFRTNIDVNQFDDNFIEDIEPLSLSCE